MEPWMWVVLALAVVIVVALVVLSARRNRRRAALRERFGPEYEHAVRQSKDRRAVEQHLEEVAHKRDTLDIHDLPAEAAARYRARWEQTQARFVDEPGQAVADADSLVTAVMRDRGYPIEDFDDRAALVATDHPDVVQHYRSAHDAYARHLKTGSADTEDLRQAFVHYRALFSELTRTAPGTEPAAGPPAAPPAEAPVEAPAAAVGEEPRAGGRHVDVTGAGERPRRVDVRESAPDRPDGR
jgi:hypothetical protein